VGDLVVKVVVVDAVRTPFGKRNGGFAGIHSIDLLGAVQRAIFERSGVDPAVVDQVFTGCVAQVGMQALNVGRNAWLAAGLPIQVPAITLDAQCGSSQQAAMLGYSAIASGTAEVVLACGVEVMSKIKMGSTVPKVPDVGKPINRSYWAHHEYTTQFEGAERMAEKWGVTRQAADEFGKQSQDRAAVALKSNAFASQLVPIAAPVLGADGEPTGETATVAQDEGVRETTLEKLATLKPTGREDGVHTAATSSQISDGASAVLMMSEQRALELGVRPLAEIVDAVIVGTDPVLMLTGPIDATRRILDRNHITMNDINLVEINEAFASVVLAWERETKADMSLVNPNGGAIALGHPLGATGSALIAKAVHGLLNGDGEQALVTMCCGGGLGTGTLVRRL
jgi:acetyl-CoA C-acetyltransferase